MPALPKKLPLLLLVLILAAACGPGKQVQRIPSPPDGWDEEGVASWYGKKFHGRRTASGERYDMYGITAAHRTLPFGTVVRNMNNGRELKVRINDRGPFVAGRIIDLSYGAARKLEMVRDGIVPVRIRVVRAPD